VLLAERGEASSAAGEAAKATERVLCAVLNSVAEGIAIHFFASLREAERCVRSLTGFDKFITGRGGMLPPLVPEVLMGTSPGYARASHSKAGSSTTASDSTRGAKVSPTTGMRACTC
jgi:hypothetical protein